eukprot:TRINITY_DN6254_c0_g1_i1.p1 TRINITY_DN6254_c0_g1~~TRINITY_DN6254_c0_g1_i1.p1  ORF type:complete len:466 (-),score=63.94 TRINITY_DN6254_c0_g1_i1:23-1420(-)
MGNDQSKKKAKGEGNVRMSVSMSSDLAQATDGSNGQPLGIPDAVPSSRLPERYNSFNSSMTDMNQNGDISISNSKKKKRLSEILQPNQANQANQTYHPQSPLLTSVDRMTMSTLIPLSVINLAMNKPNPASDSNVIAMSASAVGSARGEAERARVLLDPVVATKHRLWRVFGQIRALEINGREKSYLTLVDERIWHKIVGYAVGETDNVVHMFKIESAYEFLSTGNPRLAANKLSKLRFHIKTIEKAGMHSSDVSAAPSSIACPVKLSAMSQAHTTANKTKVSLVSLQEMKPSSAAFPSPKMDHDAASLSSLASFKADLGASKLLSHPNLATVYDAFDNHPFFFIIYEHYEPEQCLENILIECGALEEQQAKCIIRQIAHCISYLHNYGITLGDFRPSKVFLLDTESTKDWSSHRPHAKIRLTFPQSKDPISYCGYLAPEVVTKREAHFTTEADMWSFGVLCYLM